MNTTKIDWEKFFNLKLYITFSNQYEYQLFKEKLYSEFTANKKCVNDYTLWNTSPYFVYGNTHGSERFCNLTFNFFGDCKSELMGIKIEYIHQMTEFMSPLEIEKINQNVEEREIKLRGRHAGGWVSGNEGSIDMTEYRKQMEEDIKKYNREKAIYEWTEGTGTWAFSDKNKRYMGWD